MNLHVNLVTSKELSQQPQQRVNIKANLYYALKECNIHVLILWTIDIDKRVNMCNILGKRVTIYALECFTN